MTGASNPSRQSAVIILAAGKGTRMKSALPKVLHQIGNAPMLHHAMRTAEALAPERMIVVTGHGGEAVAESARDRASDVRIAVQEQQLGTGHAVLAGRKALTGFEGDLFVLFADTPFIQPETLLKMRAARSSADVVALGFEAADPAGYGRFVLGDGDDLHAIVETKDADTEQLKIRYCNSGLMAGDCATMLGLLSRLGTGNAQGEYYLTDIIGLAQGDGLTCRAVFCDETETLGINDRVQLSEAEGKFQTRARRDAMLSGVTLTAPDTVFFSLDTQLGRDVVVEPHVFFGPGVSVADDVRIRTFSHLEGAVVGKNAIVGPYARLRPGTALAEDARIGNFVEIKNAAIGAGSKVNHLSYIGDAEMGDGVNVGAGTITCNYDGFLKHKTEIGHGSFVGVNTALVAPVKVGDNAYIGTGTVVTTNVPDDALALSRTPQKNREGLAPRLRQSLAKKAAEAKAKKAGE